jgi:general secretion pathway protein D
MTIRLGRLWRGLALSLLVAGLVAPALSQDSAPQEGPDQNQAQPPQQSPGPRPGRAGLRLPGGPGGPAMRRPTPPLPAQPAQTTPPAPAPAAGAKPGQPAAATSSTAPPSRLDVSQTKGGAKDMALEVYGLDIDHLLRLLANEAGVTIIKSPDVQGAVTIIAPERVPLDVAFQIVNSVLAVRDYALVKAGPQLYKVVPAAIAIQTGDIPIHVGSNPEEVPASSELITQVIPLVNLSATDVASQVAGILSMNRSIIPTSTNCIIITDTATNIRRVLDIISYLEGELSGGPKVFRLQHIDATTMADLAASFVLSKGGVSQGGPRPAWERRVAGGGGPQSGRPGPQPQPQVQAATPAGSEYAYPDTRTNSLIVQATPIHLAQIQDLVEQFDVPISLRDSYFIYPAQHVSASQLAKLVGTIVGAGVSVVQEETTGGAAGAGGGTLSSSVTGRSGGRGQFGRSSGSGGNYPNPFQNREASPADRSPRLDPRASEAAPTVEVEPLAAPSAGARRAPLQIAQAEGMPVPGVPPMPGGEGGYVGGEEVYGPSGFGVEATITADEATNTLVITAPPEQLDAIKAMLCELDIQPPQVYISSIIAEVAVTDDNSLGFQWQNLTSQYTWANGDITTGAFGTNFGLGGEDTVSEGLSGVIVGPGDFNALLTAIGKDSHFKVLSTPSIFTSNNQPAEINVSNSTPYAVSVTVSSTGIPVTNVGYRDVGIRLLVTPRISQGGTVHMEVQVFADEPGEYVIVGGLQQPSFRTRTASATVNIQHGYTVVLGGLMRDTITSSSTKVPLLGDIPLVGALFRSSTRHKEKAELLVFLTPRIVRTPAEAQQLSQEERCKLSDIPRTLRAPLGPVAPACPPGTPPDQK